MGNSHPQEGSFILNVKSLQDWVKVEDQGFCQLWMHKKTNKQLQAYPIPESFARNQDQLQKYNFRRAHSTHLVAVQAIVTPGDTFFCSEPRTAFALVQKITSRLSQYQRSLTFQQSLYVLSAAASGYNTLNSFFGPLEPHPEMICINHEGHVKVWLNENLSLNQPSQTARSINPPSDDYSVAQRRTKECVNKLIKIVQAASAHGFGPQFTEQCSKVGTYFQTVNMVAYFCETHNVELPDKIIITRTLQNPPPHHSMVQNPLSSNPNSVRQIQNPMWHNLNTAVQNQSPMAQNQIFVSQNTQNITPQNHLVHNQTFITHNQSFPAQYPQEMQKQPSSQSLHDVYGNLDTSRVKTVIFKSNILIEPPMNTGAPVSYLPPLPPKQKIVQPQRISLVNSGARTSQSTVQSPKITFQIKSTLQAQIPVGQPLSAKLSQRQPEIRNPVYVARQLVASTHRQQQQQLARPQPVMEQVIRKQKDAPMVNNEIIPTQDINVLPSIVSTQQATGYSKPASSILPAPEFVPTTMNLSQLAKKSSPKTPPKPEQNSHVQVVTNKLKQKVEQQPIMKVSQQNFKRKNENQKYISQKEDQQLFYQQNSMNGPHEYHYQDKYQAQRQQQQQQQYNALLQAYNHQQNYANSLIKGHQSQPSNNIQKLQFNSHVNEISNHQNYQKYDNYEQNNNTPQYNSQAQSSNAAEQRHEQPFKQQHSHYTHENAHQQQHQQGSQYSNIQDYIPPQSNFFRYQQSPIIEQQEEHLISPQKNNTQIQEWELKLNKFTQSKHSQGNQPQPHYQAQTSPQKMPYVPRVLTVDSVRKVSSNFETLHEKQQCVKDIGSLDDGGIQQYIRNKYNIYPSQTEIPSKKRVQIPFQTFQTKPISDYSTQPYKRQQYWRNTDYNQPAEQTYKSDNLYSKYDEESSWKPKQYKKQLYQKENHYPTINKYQYQPNNRVSIQLSQPDSFSYRNSLTHNFDDRTFKKEPQKSRFRASEMTRGDKIDQKYNKYVVNAQRERAKPSIIMNKGMTSRDISLILAGQESKISGISPKPAMSDLDQSTRKGINAFVAQPSSYTSKNGVTYEKLRNLLWEQ